MIPKALSGMPHAAAARIDRTGFFYTLMPCPLSATIHTAALANNLAVARKHAPKSRIWAVVKANAYGHGLARAFPGLRATNGFGRFDLEEAAKLRELGWAGPILLLEGFFQPTDIDVIDRYSLTTAVHCDEQLRMLEMARLSKPINIQLKMNSGMNRLGYTLERYRAAWERACAVQGVGQITLMTHFRMPTASAASLINWRCSSAARKASRARAACRTRRRCCGIRRRILTGCGPASSSTAHRRRA